MKIITLEGENLASLAAPFHIDFASGMLADAGLFAICGNTGSGKSTLLDAICLSLFDAMPRFTSSGRGGASIGHADSEEKERLKSNDVRHILTRGAASGFAQIVFELDNGKKYQAKWSVKRARNSAQGRFQAQEMQLTDCQTNQVLAVKKTEVLAKIEELIGLNYEQFKRSVLLAQGDFAAFLKAPAKERSQLLERITGTELYSQLSKQAFERSKTQEQALALLTSKLGDVELLSADAQEQLSNDIGNINEKVEKINEQQQSLDWLTQKLAERQALEASIIDSKNTLLDALANIKQQESINNILDKIEQAQDARVVFAQRQQHQKDGHLLTENLKNLQTQFHNDQKEFETIEQQVVQLEQLKQQAQSHYEKKLPDIELAITKSIEINALKEQLANQENQLLQLDALMTAQKELQRSNDNELTTVNTDLAHNQHFLAEQEYMVSLIHHHGAVEQHIEQYGDTKFQILEHQRKIENNRLESQELLEKETELSIEAKELNKSIHQHHLQLDEFTQSFKHNNLQVLEADLSQQQAIHIELNNEQQIIVQGLQYQTMITQKMQQIESIEQELTQLRNSYRQTKHQYDQHIPIVNEAGNALAMAKQVMSLSEHRESLVAGQPCALCGSCDHPLSHNNVGNDMITSLSQRHYELEQQSAQLKDELTKFDVMGKQKAEQVQHLTHEKNELIQLIQQLNISELSQVRQGEIESQLAKVVNDIEGLKSQISQVSEWVLQAQKIEKEMLRQQHTLDTINQSIMNGQQRLATFDNDKILSNQSIEQLNQRQISRINTLTGIFNRVNWQDILSVDVEVAAFKREINTQIELYKQAQLIEQQLSEKAGKLQQQQIILNEKLSHYEGQYKPLNVQFEQENQRLTLQLKTLDTLTDGDDPQQFKQQLEQQNQELSIAHQHANTSLMNHRQNILVIQSQITQATERTTEISQLLTSLDQQWSDWQTNLNMDEDALVQLLTYEQDWIIEQRQVQAKLLQQTHQAEAIVSQQQHQLTLILNQLSEREIQLLAQFSSLAPSPMNASDPQISMVASTLTTQEKQLDEELFQFRSQLQQHNKGMVLFGELQEKIEKQQHVTQLWLEMKELIGSSNGSKFRTFAQSLTLEQMLIGANYHLKELAPRYALQRVPSGELDLQMIDRDMGDEVRSIDSLSGGETFLVSLALALGLGSLTGLQTSIRSLFIDEGFGTLDPDTLEIALSCLDSLQASGRQIGIISHVQGLVERVGTRIQIVSSGNGHSKIKLMLR